MANQNMRHVGKIANTDQKCVVAWMQLPGRETHALCIPTDSLPPRLEQAVMQVLQSPEGQSEEILANILSRRKMPDSPNSTLFETLHVGRHMVAVPVTQVIMFPRPNMPFPLADILRSQGELVSAVSAGETAARDKFNTHAHNKASMNAEQRLGVARNLILEATDLEAVANKKREQAYDLAPELKPKKVEYVNIEPEVETESQLNLPLETGIFDTSPFDSESPKTTIDFMSYFDITKPDSE